MTLLAIFEKSDRNDPENRKEERFVEWIPQEKPRRLANFATRKAREWSRSTEAYQKEAGNGNAFTTVKNQAAAKGSRARTRYLVLLAMLLGVGVVIGLAIRNKN
jgi:hypothetical protein